MKTIVNRIFYAMAFFTFIFSSQALAGESFTVTGTLDIYQDLLTGDEYSDYTFKATVSYDVPSAPDETYIEVFKEQSFFYDAITSINYSIFDGNENLVFSGVETGNLNNITSVLNDLDFSDHIREQIYWYADDPLSIVESQAVIGFYDSSGNLVDDFEDYPEPPKIDDVDYGGTTFYHFDGNTGEGLNAWGRITEVSYNSSSSGCAVSDDRGRRLRGYLRCILSRFKDWQPEWRYSREDFRKLFVNNYERREDYLKCLRENRRSRNSFIRCFSEIRDDRDYDNGNNWQQRWQEKKKDIRSKINDRKRAIEERRRNKDKDRKRDKRKERRSVLTSWLRNR